MTAKRLNEICIDAYLSCPQSDEVCDYIQNDLPKEGLYAVIKYWSDPTTIGGQTLINSGYYQALPRDVQELFNNIEIVVEKSIKQYIKNI